MDSKSHNYKEFGIHYTELLEKYLGAHLIQGRVTREAVSNVVDIISKRLNKFKCRLSSFTARAKLKKLVLESTIIHSMAIYKWPSSIIKENNTKIRNFLWSGNFEKRKQIVVKWETMNRPKREGGLGRRHLKNINLSMLMKLAWSFLTWENKLGRFLRNKFLD